MDKVNSSSDPNQLTGEESREEGSLKPRDFFWDSAILYLVSIILALSVVDALTEFIRGSTVTCNVRESDSVSSDYINSFCTEGLPITEYLPAFVFIHGLAIAIPHYLWLANFGGQFDYFFSIISTLDRSRDEETGRHSQKNVNVVRQLQQAFTIYGRNFIYYLYLGKLSLQFIFAAASLVVSAVYFTDFSVIFQCPRNNDTLDDPSWPLAGNVTCVFTSLKLLFWIRVGDIFLTCLVLLSVLWGLVWSLGGHPTELGAEKVSRFSFQSGIQNEYYIAPFSRFLYCQRCLSTFLPSFSWRFRSPGISTDLDFLLLKLYRTNAGLGQVFKEVQIDLTTQSLSDSEQEIITLHNNKHNNNIPLKIPEDKIDLKWTFDLEKGSPFSTFKTTNYSQTITVPDSVRGALLGIGSFAPNNEGALCISFGQSGIGLGLSRVFQRVGTIDFAKFKKEIKEDDDTTKLIDVKLYLASFVSVTLPQNILALSLNYNINLISGIERVWDIITRRGDKERRRTKKTSYMIIGPLESEEQGTTVTLFLQRIEDRFENDCLLLTLRPIKISGRKTKKEFIKWKPPKSFKARKIHVQTTSGVIPWPPISEPWSPISGKVKGHSVKLESDPLGTYEAFDLESVPVQQEEVDSMQTLKLMCGSHVMLTKFEIATYVYKPFEDEPESKVVVESTMQSEDKGTKDETQQKVPKTSNEKQEVIAEIH